MTIPSPEPTVHPGSDQFGAFWGFSELQQMRCSAGPTPALLQPHGTGEHGHRWLLHPPVTKRVICGSGCIPGPSIGGLGFQPPTSCDALTHSHVEPALLAQTGSFDLKGWEMISNILMVPIREVSEMPPRSGKKHFQM